LNEVERCCGSSADRRSLAVAVATLGGRYGEPSGDIAGIAPDGTSPFERVECHASQ
jgi:hypothetical protein